MVRIGTLSGAPLRPTPKSYILDYFALLAQVGGRAIPVCRAGVRSIRVAQSAQPRYAQNRAPRKKAGEVSLAGLPA